MENFYYGTNYSAFCGEHLWRSYTCPNDERIICLDCEEDCSVCPVISLSMRPCASQCTKLANSLQSFVSNIASYSILAYGVAATPQYPSFTKHPILLKTDDHSATFNISISDHGNIFCGTIPSNKPSPVSVAAMGENVVQVSVSEGHHAVLTIPNLLPSTSYTLYCVTSDFLGNMMNIQETSLSTIRFSTACCRRLQFSSSRAVIASSSTVSSIQQNLFISVVGGLSQTCTVQVII